MCSLGPQNRLIPTWLRFLCLLQLEVKYLHNSICKALASGYVKYHWLVIFCHAVFFRGCFSVFILSRDHKMFSEKKLVHRSDSMKLLSLYIYPYSLKLITHISRGEYATTISPVFSIARVITIFGVNADFEIKLENLLF